MERGLVADAGVGSSTGGRPPRQLGFRADAGHVLRGRPGGDQHRCRDDPAGRPTSSAHQGEPADIADGPEALLERVEELFETLRVGSRRLPGRLWGVGIGVPGPVEFRTGRPTSPPIMPGWDGYPVRERLSARYEAPVWVDNDVNVLTLGEWRSGVAVGHENVVVIKIGTGIGAGIISDGRLHRGAQGSAGDVGHIQVLDDASVASSAAATSGAWRRWPAARRWRAMARRRRASDAASACGPRLTGMGA